MSDRVRCNGTSYIFCRCGGDFCVCSLADCPECLGCEDCEPPTADELDQLEWQYLTDGAVDE